MRSMAEIRKNPRIVIQENSVDWFRGIVHPKSSWGRYTEAFVIASWGCWWDHISVSFSGRTPTWEEMAEIKEMFFMPDEVCVQYHPAENEYVNEHKHCLHIFRPQRDTLPRPPYWMVGRLPGQTMEDVLRDADEEMNKWEDEVCAHSRRNRT